MKKFISIISLMLCMAFMISGIAACKTEPSAVQEKIELDSTHIILKIGEQRKLSVSSATDSGQDFVWLSDDENIATVDGEGNVSAVNVGTASISVTLGSASDFCQVTVTEEGDVSADDENKVDGYIYFEDFEDRTDVPAYLRKSVSGGGEITLNEGNMSLETKGTGTAFATYEFDETLSGRIIAETRVKVGSTAFSNILFFYRGEYGYDTNDAIACLGMDAGGFKNHNGSAWSSSIKSYSVNTWYEIKMVLDIGSGKYSLYIDGVQYPDQQFRKTGDGVEDRIKLLKFGTDKSNAGLTYDYIKISGDYAPSINAETSTYAVSLEDTKSVTLRYGVTGTPSPEISVISDCPTATVSADNRTVTFSEDTVSGTYKVTVKAQNEYGTDEKTFNIIVRADSSVLLDTDFSDDSGFVLNSSNGAAEVKGDQLVLTTQSSGTVLTYAKYDFGINLSGKVQAETRIMIDSSAFLNILFLYRSGTQSIDATRCTSSLAIEKNTLKYHNGSGWVSISSAGAISNNTWYDLKAIYDYDNYTMDVWLDGVEVLSGGRMRVASDDTSVLIMGSDKTSSVMMYDYLKFTLIGE